MNKGVKDVTPPRRMSRLSFVAVIGVSSAVALGLVIFVLFPLFRPLRPSDRIDAIRGELAAGRLERAAGVASIAVGEFPDSSDLAELYRHIMLRLGRYDDLRHHFEKRIGPGYEPSTADEAIALARTIRASGGPPFSDLRRLTGPSSLLLRLASDSGFADDIVASRSALRDSGVTTREVVLGEDATLEGYVVDRTSGGRHLTLYFRSQVPWRGRALWVHAYPPESHDYIDLGAVPQTFDGWRPGELAWERFEFPATGRFNVYVGFARDSNLGPAYPLGWIN